MSNNVVPIPFEYIKTISIMQKCKGLLGEFTGLDIEVFNIDGSDLRFPCSLKNRQAWQPSSLKSDAGSCPCECQSDDCNKLHPDVLNDIICTKKISFFFCPAMKTKVAVPLLLNGELSGIFFAGENGTEHFDRTKFDALANFLYQVGNYITENESVFLQYFKGTPITYKQQLLNKVVRYIWSNAHKNGLTLKDAARDNGISYCYLSHLFKDELKITFVEYRTNVKMHIAAKLLKDFRLTIDQISQACGFDDSSYFCKSFKKSYGCTAGHFRRRFILGHEKRNINSLLRERNFTAGFKIPRSTKSIPFAPGAERFAAVSFGKKIP